MARPDLNLLFTLDVLLAEGSVARAARRLRLSPSAIRCWCGPGAVLCPHPGRSSLASASVNSSTTPKQLCAPPTSWTSGNSSEPSRCGPVRALSRTSESRCWLASAKRPPASACAFCTSSTRTAGHCARSVDLETGIVDNTTSPGACAGLVQRPLHWRRANRAPAERGRNHPVSLCRLKARSCLAPRQRRGPH